MSIVVMVLSGIAIAVLFKAISNSFMAGWIGGVTCLILNGVIEKAMS